MPYDKPPEKIKSLPEKAQHIWVAAFNSAWKQYKHDEERANKVAWGSVKRSFKQDSKTKKWSKMADSDIFRKGDKVKIGKSKGIITATSMEKEGKVQVKDFKTGKIEWTDKDNISKMEGETTASSLDTEGKTINKSFAGKTIKKKKKEDTIKMEETKLGKNQAGVRDGSGPFKDSFRRKVEGKSIGRRQEAGEICPADKKKQKTMSKFKKWTTAYKNALPDSAFAIVTKEGDKTVRKLPYKDKEGKVDVPHLRNALVRVAQGGTKLSPAQRASALGKLKAMAKKYLKTYKETKSGKIMSKFISKFEEEKDSKITQIKNRLKSLAEGKKPDEMIEISVKQISLLIQDLEVLEENNEEDEPAGEEEADESKEKTDKEDSEETKDKEEDNKKKSKKKSSKEEPEDTSKDEKEEKDDDKDDEEDKEKNDEKETEEESKFQELLGVCDGYKKELGKKDEIISKMGKRLEKLESETSNLTKEISKFKQGKHDGLVKQTAEMISKFKNLDPHEKIRLEHEYSKMSDSALVEIGRITESEMFSKLEEPKPTTQPSEMLKPSNEEEKPFSKMSKEEQLDALASSNAKERGFVE